VNGTLDIDAVRVALEEALASWLPRQRWYGGGQAIRAVRCDELSPIANGSPDVAVCIATVEHEDATHDTYNVPVALSSPGGVRPSDPAAIIHEDDDTLVFDALADARSAAALWRVLASGSSVQLRTGRLSVGGGGGLDASAADIAPLAREQSNTSLVVGGKHLLKVMRKLTFEPSVELEMTRALDEAGFDHLAPPQAWLHYERDDQPHGALLAIAQPFLHNGTEGWTLALTSLRDLYADAEEHVPGDAAERTQAVEDAGGSFTAEAARLGDITAQMHLALAQARGADLAAQPITATLLAEWADEMITELDALIARDGGVHDLAGHRAALEARISAIRTLREPGLAIRIHGDYHLGQVLRTDSGWTVLDFEGEPRRPVEHRRRRHSPLRDVAGMLRSFDYAASVALLERLTPADPRWDHVRAHGLSWAAANREAFWAAYVERTAGSRLLPDPGAALTLRRAFEIQKATYEVGYEMAHRPSWVPVPLGFLLEATA
jgi:maltokinase